MSDDADLVRRARAAIAAGDPAVAKRAAAELWARYEQHAVVASRRVARGAEADDVLGHIGLRFTKWVYHGHDDPRNMVGLIGNMARYAAFDVTRDEAGEAPTVEDISLFGGAYDDDFDAILARDEIDRLRHVLSDRDAIIIDRMLEDAADADVAAELGIDPNNLHQIRFRALRRMREAADQGESGP